MIDQGSAPGLNSTTASRCKTSIFSEMVYLIGSLPWLFYHHHNYYIDIDVDHYNNIEYSAGMYRRPSSPDIIGVDS